MGFLGFLNFFLIKRRVIIAIAALAIFSFGTAGACPGCGSLAAQRGGELRPETALAEWDKEAIRLEEFERHLAAKSAGLGDALLISETALLELLIRRRMLAEMAVEAGMEKTEAYQDVYRRISSEAENGWMSESDIRFRALAEIYLQREVVDKMEIEEADLKEMFSIFRPSMPKGTMFEDVRNQLVNKLKRQAVERFVRKNIDRRRVTFNEEWLEEIKERKQNQP